MNVFGVIFITDPLMRDYDPDDLEYSEPERLEVLAGLHDHDDP